MKHRGEPAGLLRRTSPVTAIAAVMLTLACTANGVAIATNATAPAGLALLFAGFGFVLLLVFRP